MVRNRLTFISLFSFCAFTLLAYHPTKKRLESELELIPDERIVHRAIASKPSFPGGDEAMHTFIQKTRKYPKHFSSLGIEGKVLVGFRVDENGKLQNIKLVKGIHQSLNKEALKVVKAMPNWKPGTDKGAPKAMNVQVSIDFYFLR